MSESVAADRQRDVLLRAGLVLASELSLPALLQKMVELACQVADARYGALGVLGPEGTIDEFVTYGVTQEERQAIGDLPVGKGILGVLIREARPLRLRRIQDDPRSAGFPDHHPSMTSFLGVPVKVGARVFGNLYLTEKRGADEFTEEDERAVVTLAAQAAVAVENARLYEEARTTQRRLAVLEDRERIAKELHDGVVQSLFATGMALQAATQVAADPEAVRERLEGAVDAIDRVIRELRNYIFGLGPGGTASRRLADSLEDLVAGFRDGAESVVEADIDPDAAARLTDRDADVIQAAREALSNALRHSGATHVTLRLLGDGTNARLEVEDDGAGFDPEAVAGHGRGLANLEARATSLGGRLDVQSRPGAGTRVVFRIPLEGLG